MAKTTFLGYVPSLKSKHEATIVGHKAIQSKGGSIRYTLQGEYQGRKTLPKTVSKADFEGVYGFDAKEAESVIINGTKDAETVVGNPSPADVEPSAPSEKPFPQEPSNENFSAHSPYLRENPSYYPPDEGFFQIDVKHKMEDGWEHYGDYDNEEDATSAYYDIYLNHPEVQLLEVDAEGDGDVIYKQRNYDLDVKEAFGFGKKEEEKEEPKTQEFTVVLQEGDKLELTDVEEEQAAPDDENEEKEAETLEITDIDWETDEEDVDLPASVLVPSSIVEDEIADYLSDEYGFLVRGYVLNAETYEAVQAKVTRPVKEEKEESDEGLSTGAKVALGVGALAAGVALFGAEDECPSCGGGPMDVDEYGSVVCTECEDTFFESEHIPYESETDYSRIYEATSGEGYINHDRINTEEHRLVELRYDDPTTYYDWTSNEDVDEDDVEEAIKEELGNEPDKGTQGATVEVKNQNERYVDVDVDMDTDYGDSRLMGMGYAAEHESESDGFTYAYTKGHKDGMKDEVVYRPSIDTDREKTIYKKILKQKAETFEAEKLHPGLYRYKGKIGMRKGWTECQECDDLVKLNDINWYYLTGYGQATVCDSCVGKYNYKKDRLSKGHRHGELATLQFMEQDRKGADTVGNPSPSGPSSTPEPTEATGSEPSNENMEAEGSNLKMALGVLGVGVGAVALLGGDRIKKIFEKLGL